jgi:hypothetical protein
MTVKPPAPPPLPQELDRLLRRLRLPYVRRAAPEMLATAAAQRWEHSEVLKVLLAEEAQGRDQATIQMRRRASGLPAGKTFNAWEHERSVIPKPTQQALRTLEWVERAEVLCVCGPSTPCSHCPPRCRHWSNSPAPFSDTLILRPFRRPLTTWTACSSPRWTLCKTV